jgi:hypothetical protein
MRSSSTTAKGDRTPNGMTVLTDSEAVTGRRIERSERRKNERSDSATGCQQGCVVS